MRRLNISPFFLRGVDNDSVDVSPLVVEAVEETTNRDGVLGTLIQCKLQRGREYNSLVSVSLEQGLDFLGLSVDNDTADTTKLPRPTDAIR